MNIDIDTLDHSASDDVVTADVIAVIHAIELCQSPTITVTVNDNVAYLRHPDSGPDFRADIVRGICTRYPR